MGASLLALAKSIHYMGFGHPGLSRIVKIGTDVNLQNIFCF